MGPVDRIEKKNLILETPDSSGVSIQAQVEPAENKLANRPDLSLV